MSEFFTNCSERYGELFVRVEINDYRDINPEGDFKQCGDEIREYFTPENRPYQLASRSQEYEIIATRD